MTDPVAFSSDRLPTGHFNERFSDDNLAFWVPALIETGRIGPADRVLDVGCGTGGFSRAIAERASAEVTGVDRSARFVAFATEQPAPARGSVAWAVGDAERLPFDDLSFDRVLLSLVLHQLAEPRAAVGEAFRVLVEQGTVVVRTIAPEDVGSRVPERYVPSMAAADTARLPTIETIDNWLTGAGFARAEKRRILRNKKLTLVDEERQLMIEARSRYAFIAADELAEGLRRLRADAGAHPDGLWFDPRPTYLLAATRPAGR